MSEARIQYWAAPKLDWQIDRRHSTSSYLEDHQGPFCSRDRDNEWISAYSGTAKMSH